MAQVQKKSSPITKPKQQNNCQAISDPAARRACLRAAGAKAKPKTSANVGNSSNTIIDQGTPNYPGNPKRRKKNRSY